MSSQPFFILCTVFPTQFVTRPDKRCTDSKLTIIDSDFAKIIQHFLTSQFSFEIHDLFRIFLFFFKAYFQFSRNTFLIKCLKPGNLFLFTFRILSQHIQTPDFFFFHLQFILILIQKPNRCIFPAIIPSLD